MCQLALRAADAMHDLRARANLLRHIGWTLVLRGDLTEAGTYLTEARALAVDQGDIKAEADAVGDLAEIERLNGNLAEARQLRTQSLALSEQAGNQRDAYVERTLLAQIALEERNLEVARNGFMESSRIAQELPGQDGDAAAAIGDAIYGATGTDDAQP